MRTITLSALVMVFALGAFTGPATADAAGPRAFQRTPPAPGDIVVRPSDDVGAIVRSAPAGSTIRFRQGIYRMLELEPKADVQLIADPGVILKGSKRLAGFVASGNRWYVGGQTQGSAAPTQGNEWGYCEDALPACVYPEELFINGNRKKRASSLAEVGPGRWYFDYGADRIYVGDNPNGQRVETSVARWAVHGQADRVRVEGFAIVQYATPARQGAINPRVGRVGAPGTDWEVVGNTIITSHGWAVKIEDGIVIADNVMAWNGQGGVGGVGDEIVVEHNTIKFSCSVGIKCFGFEGGALKIDSDTFAINNNVVENNWGHGIHPDQTSSDGEIIGNVVTGNEGVGIHYETSTDVVISGNTVTGNGYRRTGAREPGILVLDSSNVTIDGNTVSNNALGIVVRQDNRTDRGIVANVDVTNNTVVLGSGERSGIGQLHYSNIGPVTFSGNAYTYTEGSPMLYDGRWETVDGWRNRGYDTNGSFSRS